MTERLGLDAEAEARRLRSAALQASKSILVVQRRAEEELRQAKRELEDRSEKLARTVALLNATLDATDGGIMAIDLHQRVTCCNKQLTAMWKLAPDALDDAPVEVFLELTEPLVKHPAAYVRRVRELATRPRSAALDRIDLLDGRILECYAKPQTVDQTHLGVVFDFRDVTEQWRSAERTRSLVEATTQAIWTASSEGLIEAPSASWQALTGQTADEMRGLGWLDTIDAEDRARVQAAWQLAVHSGQTFSEEFRVWSVHHRFLYIRARGVPVLAADGRTVEWIVANSDVTEQVDAQQQLRERARYAAFRSSLKAVLSASDDIDTMLALCCEQMTTHLNVVGAALWQLDGELELRAAHGLVPPATMISTMPVDGNDIGRLAQSERGQLHNSLGHRFSVPFRDWLASMGIVSMAGHPIPFRNRTFGVLVGFSNRILPVNIVDELRDAAETIGAWLLRVQSEREQALSLAREQAARMEAETIVSMVETLARTPDLKTRVQHVTNAGTHLTGAAFGAFFFKEFDESGESYMLYTLSGVAPENFSKLPMPRNTAVFAATFSGGGTVRSDDIQADPHYGHNPPYHGLPEGHLPVRSYLAVPVLRRDGSVIGGLFFGHPHVGRFSEHHARLAESVALHASIAFDRPLPTAEPLAETA